MNLYHIIAILITITALLSYINARYIRLPNAIGLLLIALLISLSMQGLKFVGIGIEDLTRQLLLQIDFSNAVMQGMLCFLLFAGALHINLDDLMEVKWVVTLLATLGVLLTAVMIGSATYYLFGLFSLSVPFIYCLLFGALISPTDPIAVLAILKRLCIPKSLETKIAGESLFNDGIGVVLFLVLSEIAFKGSQIDVSIIFFHFLQEVLGGILFGLLIGWLTYRMLRNIDNYQVEILLTLALVAGGYALASYLHVSGPIAIVVAGLLIGNEGRRFALSDTSRKHLDAFWELVDEMLNAILFVLIGLEVLVISMNWKIILTGLCIIPIVLVSRFIVVGSTISFLKLFRDFSKNAIVILTWGGMRGGISIALALSLPLGEIRHILLAATYLVVVFTILVQGLTLKYMLVTQK